jgi:4-amino-4-deoxy-L-arabinose transferase-like glycosyltransferase
LEDHAASESRYRRVTVIVVSLAIGLYLLLALGSAFTQRPWCDEAWNASPAFNLITKGYMGTSFLETAGTTLQRLDRYTYWILPLHPLALAGWYEIFGFGILQTRSLSMAWGLVALWSLYLFMKSLSGDRRVALLTVFLLALDFVFVQRSSEGRMDMMSAALGFAGLALYLSLRTRTLNAAILAGNAFVACSALTHPNGVMAFVALIFLALYFDRQRLRWRHVAIAAAPYLVGVISYGFYIAKDPSSFLGQIGWNAAGRFKGVWTPWSALRTELVGRYLRYLGGVAPDLSTAHRLKLVVLAAYASGVFGSLFTAAIRRHNGYRALLIITGIYVVFLTFFEARKSPLYLIHIVPLFAGLLSAWLWWCWHNIPRRRWLIVSGAGVFLMVQIGGAGYVIVRNTYGKNYMPVVNFLKHNASPDGLVMGSAELAFALGFDSNIVDDPELGYSSGRCPQFIVLEARYEVFRRYYRENAPGTYRHVEKVLNRRYKPVFRKADYTVYIQREGKPNPASASSSAIIPPVRR